MQIEPAEVRGPADDSGRRERAQPRNDADAKSESQDERVIHGGESITGREHELIKTNEGEQKKEGPPPGIGGPKGRVPLIQPRRDRIMGSSIQLPSQGQVGTTHTILQVGPFLPTYRTMRIVLERDPRRI